MSDAFAREVIDTIHVAASWRHGPVHRRFGNFDINLSAGIKVAVKCPLFSLSGDFKGGRRPWKGKMIRKVTVDAITAFDRNALEYDRWFDEHRQVYHAELLTLQGFVPDGGLGMEVGAGTGRFAIPLGLRIGVEPAQGMAQIAAARGLAVCRALGEYLPFRDDQFDFALMVTVDCFLISRAPVLLEISRALKTRGRMIVGFIDRETPLGQFYESGKDQSKFYESAHFYSAPEIAAFMENAGFREIEFRQTILGIPSDDPTVYDIRPGYGQGAFAVLKAIK